MQPFQITDVHSVLVREKQHELRRAERCAIHTERVGTPIRNRVANMLIQTGERLRSDRAPQSHVDAEAVLKVAS